MKYSLIKEDAKALALTSFTLPEMYFYYFKRFLETKQFSDCKGTCYFLLTVNKKYPYIFTMKLHLLSIKSILFTIS